MEWLLSMNEAIVYIEDNLQSDIDLDKVAKIACCSTYHFQRLFSFITEVPLAEYIRRRKLSVAGMMLKSTDHLIIDLALMFGYESPNAFTRAFKSLHGITPSEARKGNHPLQCYPPIAFHLSIKGDVSMTYRFEEKEAYKVFGISRIIANDENPYEVIPKFWESFQDDGTYQKICEIGGIEPYKEVSLSAALYDFNNMGAYRNRYMIHMPLDDNKVIPAPLEVMTIPKAKWVVFSVKYDTIEACTNAIQTLWRRIFTEWFPASEFEMTDGPQLEVYPTQDTAEVWIPIQHKE